MSCELSNPMQLGLLVIGATIATNVTEAMQDKMESEGVLQCCDGVKAEHDPNPPLQQEKQHQLQPDEFRLENYLLHQRLHLSPSYRSLSEECDRFARDIETALCQERDRLISFLQGVQIYRDNTKSTQPRQNEPLQGQYLDAIQDAIQDIERKLKAKEEDRTSYDQFVSYTDDDPYSGERLPKLLQSNRLETRRNHDIQSKDCKQVIERRCLTLYTLLMMLMPACLQYLQLFQTKKQICKGSDDNSSTSSTRIYPREKAKEANQATRRQKSTTESVTGFCRQPQVNWSNVRSVLVC